ncbi:unnamed protein product [Arabidopsis lyrata]|uniref:F-box domain-containing protein n=1 Tax=Arabidopsis lyrata subsp. lyrata TaxID=81972 RepID=D7KSF2_ARALL|nr:hypothetical protein ARALYDRAFT_894152 [Arabidopsis lyrata subsp. lyrata]CAH8257049.1 unnamed protein product [Arabidopsis lyrata]
MRTQPSHLARPIAIPVFFRVVADPAGDHHQNRMTGDEKRRCGHYQLFTRRDFQLIFFFIPIKFAIRTSVLSKRWRHVWSETPFLSIDCRSADANSINKTLASYSAPKIMSFHLCISSKAHEIDIA